MRVIKRRLRTGWCAPLLLSVAALSVCPGCASASTQTVAAQPGGAEPSVQQALRAMAGLGYKIQAISEKASIVTAERPITGIAASFSMPGAGHQVTVRIEQRTYHVQVFPADGASWGAMSPDDVAEELRQALVAEGPSRPCEGPKQADCSS